MASLEGPAGWALQVGRKGQQSREMLEETIIMGTKVERRDKTKRETVRSLLLASCRVNQAPKSISVYESSENCRHPVMNN